MGDVERAVPDLRIAGYMEEQPYAQNSGDRTDDKELGVRESIEVSDKRGISLHIRLYYLFYVNLTC